MQHQPWGQLVLRHRDVDGLQPTETDAHGRGYLGNAQLLADLQDGGHELSSGQGAHEGSAVAGSGETQRPVPEIGVEVSTERSGGRGVPTRKDQYDWLADPGG